MCMKTRFNRSHIFFADDDFFSDADLSIECTILQKQIEYINGRKENIIVPSIGPRQLPERNQPYNLSSNNISIYICKDDILDADIET